MEKRFCVDKLVVSVLPNRELLGKACAEEAAVVLRDILSKQDTASIIFASAPSQLEMLSALRAEPGIDWSRVYAFHMDEYIGLPADAPQSFGNYLRTRFFNTVQFKDVFYMDGNAEDMEGECERYASLLRQHPVDISFVGIGENGHLAFNDPHIADFDDPQLVKVNPELDAACRQQQVTDGWFARVEDIPHSAITITIPGLMAAPYVFGCVPGKTKQAIIQQCLEGPVTKECAGSIMRHHDAAHLFLDADSAALLDFDRWLAKAVSEF